RGDRARVGGTGAAASRGAPRARPAAGRDPRWRRARGGACRRGAGLVAEPVAGMCRAQIPRRQHRRAAGHHAREARQAVRRSDLSDSRPAGVDGDDEPALRPRVCRDSCHLSRAKRAEAAMTDGPRLPGDLPAGRSVERMIRVDHAGEYGAARIYAGQLAVLGRGAKGDMLRHMQAQEQRHLDTFDALIADRRVRPTVLLPLWNLAGFALGAATAALGERAAMACTVAVEETIDKHYAGQV